VELRRAAQLLWVANPMREPYGDEAKDLIGQGSGRRRGISTCCRLLRKTWLRSPVTQWAMQVMRS